MDERNIQRLVDGELSRDAIDALLDRCHERPELWRTLALSLLEHRCLESAASAWGSETRDAVDEIIAESISTLAPVVVSETMESSHTSIVQVEGSASVEATSGSKTLSWMGMAAAVAICCGAIGYLLGQGLAGQMNAIAPTQSVAQIPNGGSASEQPGRTNSSLNNAPQMAHSVPDRASNDSTEIPEYYISSPTSSGVVTPEKQREWLRQGLWVEEIPTVEAYEVDGRRYIVPRSRYDVKYVGGLAYQ